MFLHARRTLDGPPPALPRPLDRLSERWWRARPRTRVALGASIAGLVLLTLAARLLTSPHGPPAVVWVAVRDLAVGEQLDRSVLQRATWPTGLLPDGALPQPDGTLVAPLPRGAVATDRHLGELGPAAGLGSGTALVPVPVESLPSVPVGARLDVVVADGSDGAGRTVAHDAMVLRDDGQTVWLVVDADQANALAGATLQGTFGIVLIPP